MVRGETNRLGAGTLPAKAPCHCRSAGSPEGETCAAPVTAGRATIGSAIGPTPAFQRGQAHQREGLGRHGAVVSRRSEHEPAGGRINEQRRAPAPLIRTKGCCRAIDPRWGDFSFRDFSHAPSDKNCPKMFRPIKGVAFL
jgi:hypothetical protein